MKFRCTTDKWREFRGYVFAYGKPTEIRDRGTIEALNGHPDFEFVEDDFANGHDVMEPPIVKRKPGRPRKSQEYEL